jgi:sec-independent protein translocase protein TatB
MFNLSGSEIVFLLLIALIVLGPEKLPEAVRKFGQVYAEVKKMSSGFQSELKSALDEPMREMRETAEAFKNAANFDFKFDGDEPAKAIDEPVTAADEPAVTTDSVEPVVPPAVPAGAPMPGGGEAIVPVADQGPRAMDSVDEGIDE